MCVRNSTACTSWRAWDVKSSKKSGPWVLFRNPMVYSVLPMVNSTIVLRVIVGHGVVRLQVQMRFCYPNGGVLSHGLTCEVCFGPNNEAWACFGGLGTSCEWAEGPCRPGVV